MDWKICDFMTHDRVLVRERFTQPIKNKKSGKRKEKRKQKVGKKARKKKKKGVHSTSGVRGKSKAARTTSTKTYKKPNTGKESERRRERAKLEKGRRTQREKG